MPERTEPEPPVVPPTEPEPPVVPPTPAATEAWQPSIEPPPVQPVWQPGAAAVAQPEAPAWAPDPAEVAPPEEPAWEPEPAEVAQPEQESWEPEPSEVAQPELSVWTPEPAAVAQPVQEPLESEPAVAAQPVHESSETAPAAHEPSRLESWVHEPVERNPHHDAWVQAKRPRSVFAAVVLAAMLAVLVVLLHLNRFAGQFGSTGLAAAAPGFLLGLLVAGGLATCAYFVWRRRAWARIALTAMVVANVVVGLFTSIFTGVLDLAVVCLLFGGSSNAWFKYS